MMQMRKNPTEPLRHGVARVPVVIQIEALECGAACLAMILAYYGRWIPLEQVRADCGVSRDGSRARNLLLAARGYGLTAGGYRCASESLRQNGTFPCIVHWEFNHFVVLCGFRGNKAVINDPAKGTYSVSMPQFDAAFTGICLMFAPDKDFQPSGKPKSILAFIKKKLTGTGSASALVIITTAITSLIGIITPGFSNVFADHLLSGTDPQWFIPFIYGISALAAIQIIVAWIQAVYSLKANGKIAVVANCTYMWHVLRLPMSFFSQRMAGDIAARRSRNETVAGSIVSTFAPLGIQALMMLFYLFVMLRYSVVLSLIGVASIALNMLAGHILSQKSINRTRVAGRNRDRLIGATVNGIDMIESIKAAGAEDGFFEKWAGYQAEANASETEYALSDTCLEIIPRAISAAAGTAVFMGSVFLCRNGRWTIGMITAFSGFLSAFLAPAEQLVTASRSFQEMRTDMERIEDVMEYPTAVPQCDEPLLPDVEYRKLSGKIEMRHVTFGYSRLEEPLIRDFSMTLLPGKRVAFVGASGCGKSTLSRLISGLYKPWSGEILFDGKPIDEIHRSVLTGSLAVVDQDITLFEDTAADNIKMWDDSIEDFEMILAARDAQIHNDIMQREGGYRFRLSQSGRNLSGGQRQRLEIARVLTQDPTIIIMDEATSALDAKTEYDVVRSISERGITCIVIAHRLSTIRDCDEIIVLDHGQVLERGTHDALLALGGHYAELVCSE